MQFQFEGGRGIGAYLVSFGGSNYDAAPDGEGNMETLPTFGGWVSYEHWFSRRWHANIVAGFAWFSSHEIQEYFIPGPGWDALNSSVQVDHQYIVLNLMYDPLPGLIFGIEYNLGRKDTRHEGEIITEDETLTVVEKGRTAQRISFGAFFNF